MFAPLEVPPGIVKSDSDYAARGRWIDCDHVRFVKGKPEKVGGVQKFIQDQFDGIARGALAWTTYTGISCLMWGTACKLYIYREGTLSAVTPYRADAIGDAMVADPFAVVDTETLVTVTHAGHGAEAGTIVTFDGATAGGGITIDGDYEIVEVIDVNTYTIEHSSPATATDATTGGASVTASYELNCGNVDPTYLLGWGVGGWGVGYWGTDASLASAIVSEPTTWSFAVYGEDAIVNPAGGAIYHYDASSGANRPGLLANAPTQVRFTFVTPERYIFALGCTTLAGGYDPMTVRWPDIEDPTDWTPAETNRANERKLQGGTRLMGGTALTDGLSLVWSDAAVFTFQFTGSNLVYDSRKAGENCGLLAPHAHAERAGGSFWMGDSKFWMFDGYVREIPNADDILDHVFKNISKTHGFKAFAFYVPKFDEVWFVYPSALATEPDRYAMVALSERYAWAIGTWDRSAAASFTVGENRPILFGTDGYVYVHDVEDNPDDDGAALPSHLELAPTDIRGGNTLVDIWGLVPDTQRQTGQMSVYLYGKDHPRDDEFMSDTVTIEPTTKLADVRGVAGRQVGMIWSTSATGCDWRLGSWGIDIESTAGEARGRAA